MNIGVDKYPKELIPFKAFDYATKSLVGLFYVPLVSKQVKQSLANVYKYNELGWRLILKEGAKWSNGQMVKLEDILKTWEYILENCPLFSKELDWIKNWKMARKRKCSFNSVGLKVKNNVLYIELQYPINVTELLSNIGFTPVCFNLEKDILPVGTGAFVPSNDGYCYESNKEFKPYISNEMKLILTESPEDAIDKYKNNIIEVTPTTLFDSRLLDKIGGTKICQISNVHVGLVLLTKKAKKLKNIIQKRIVETEYQFHNIRKTTNYFFSSSNDFEVFNTQSIFNSNKAEKEILRIGVTNYYPNLEMVAHFFKDYITHLKVIPLDSLNEVIIEDESIDIVYTLFTTAVVNDLTLLLSYIPFIEKEFVEEYIRLLNQRNINNLTLLEKTKINNF
ncbi:hypothetical protein SD624_001594, partial [Enterococcus faecalis]|nr:hypothetical protein [Enterococcus faecalis]